MGLKGRATAAEKEATEVSTEPDQATKKACLQATPKKMKRNDEKMNESEASNDRSSGNGGDGYHRLSNSTYDWGR